MTEPAADDLTAEEEKYFEEGAAEDTVAPVPDAPEAVPSPPEEPEEPPAGAADQETEGEPSKPPTGYVEHGAFHQERERRKELQAEVARQRDTISRMEGAFGEVIRRLPGEGEARPTIDPEEDPEGYWRQRSEILDNRLETIEQGIKEQGQVNAQTAQQQAFIGRYQAATEDFARGTTDFHDAYAFLAKSVDEELVTRGYTDPQERANVLRYEEAQLVNRAFEAGINPGERLYAVAKARGYVAKAAGNSADVSRETKAEQSTIDRLSKGQKAATPKGGGAGDAGGEISLERLSQLDGQEFDLAWEKARKSGRLG